MLSSSTAIQHNFENFHDTTLAVVTTSTTGTCVGSQYSFKNDPLQTNDIWSDSATADCWFLREFHPDADFCLTHHPRRPSGAQQRLHGHRAGSLEIGRLGQSDVGIHTHESLVGPIRLAPDPGSPAGSLAKPPPAPGRTRSCAAPSGGPTPPFGSDRTSGSCAGTTSVRR